MKHGKQWLAGTLLLLGTAAAFLYWREVGAALRDAGERCVTVILPSLYLCSILAAMCVRAGVTDCLARPLGWLLRPMRGDGALLAVLMFSQLGGYPIGAQLLHALHRQGRLSLRRMRSLLCVCICSGPAFLLGTVCGSMGLDAKIGWLLLGSAALPNLAAGLCLLRGSGGGEQTGRASLHWNAQVLTDSVEAGAAAMWKVCSMILFFAGGMGILNAAGILPALSRWLSEELRIPEVRALGLLESLLDVSCLPGYLECGGSLPGAAALLSFGGICVHCQLAALCGGQLPWGRFLLTRSAAAAVSYGLCGLLLKLCRFGTVPAALGDPAFQPVPSRESGWAGVCLVVMSVMVMARVRGKGGRQI